MSPVEKTVLKYINDNGEIKNTENFDVEQKLDKVAFENTLKSLSAEEYIKLNVIERKEIELTDEGKSYAQNGSPEF
jgi:phenylalanyl-tRNA synthetase alpha chain